jgi:predicted Ser/Thr protein kinase
LSAERGTPDSREFQAQNFLERTIRQAQERFVGDKSILSFREYLDVVSADPKGQARDAATFVRDCFLHYGTEVVDRPFGRFTRYKLFDCPFDGGRNRLFGHEPVQAAVFGLVSDFVREGRVNKLILLHGPNGSAKTSFISCLVRALEHYSHEPAGALYTFNWVFPSTKVSRGAIGFGGGRSLEDMPSYAHLADGDVDAIVRSEVRDHPLLLLPPEDRRQLLRTLLGEGAQIPQALTEGDLSPKSRAIYDALLRAYKGDLAEVLKHVQVVRFHVSRRYRQAAVTVDPQMRTDAGVRQVTADRSMGSLPPSLQNLSLFEPMGELVDANRGVIEYNDLLKRPLEAFKYLLSTCEKGTVSLDTMTLQLDTLFIASSNATHLQAFQELPDFASFKARIELVQVPYLIDYKAECRIYAEQIAQSVLTRPVAPHTAEVAALWGVLTRLERPQSKLYAAAIQKVLQAITPLQKAMLYADGTMPNGLPRDVANELRGVVPRLYQERAALPHYEGRFGASPRELKAALLGAARREGHRCLSPLALFEELEELVKQKPVYEFLRLDPDGEYHRPDQAIETVREWYLRLVEDELYEAMGLVDVLRTRDLFRRYIDHVTHYVRKEKRHNPVTGRYEDPDENLMREVEGRLGLKPEQADDARAGAMHRIAAWRMDHPKLALDFDEIFAEQMTRLRDSYYEEKRQLADRMKRNLLAYLVEDQPKLDAEEREAVERTFQRLESRFGYDRECAIDVIGSILRQQRRRVA